MNFAQAMAALGLTTDQLLYLMRNAQFPTPSYAAFGNATWPSGDIPAFAATMAAVRVNGWNIDFQTGLASANWTTLAATTPGPYYRAMGANPLFDLINGD